MKKIELLMDSSAVKRTLSRITRQILENISDLENMCIIGMQTRGVYLARRICKEINEIEGVSLKYGILDPTLYRDDIRASGNRHEIKATDIPFDINGKRLVLVDDVIFTGRTIRASLDALTDFGRPQTIRLAVLVDRGHRELPIKPDFTGMDIVTARNQEVSLNVSEIDGEDSLWLMQLEEAN